MSNNEGKKCSLFKQAINSKQYKVIENQVSFIKLIIIRDFHRS